MLSPSKHGEGFFSSLLALLYGIVVPIAAPACGVA